MGGTKVTRLVKISQQQFPFSEDRRGPDKRGMISGKNSPVQQQRKVVVVAGAAVAMLLRTVNRFIDL